MIFDTHAHYDDDAFDEDRDTLLGEIFSSAFVVITDVGASVNPQKVRLLFQKVDRRYMLPLVFIQTAQLI